MDCQVLKKCALFRNVPEDDLMKILQGFECNVRVFVKGETVFRFMDHAESVGIVLEGSIAGIKPFPDGSEMSVTLRRPGDLLGQAAACGSPLAHEEGREGHGELHHRNSIRHLHAAAAA